MLSGFSIQEIMSFEKGKTGLMTIRLAAEQAGRRPAGEKAQGVRVCGVVCEYDPFHNGHAHHLARLRENGFDHIVCVMSGHFTQRGHAAILSKWARAEMALRSGADAVFELPTLFAVRDAERFARGGVSLLTSLGAVTHIGFGSESGDLAALYEAARQAENRDAIRLGLLRGETLARARGALLGLPNDILAVEYLRAIRALGSGLAPVAIQRAGDGFHAEGLSAMPSATGVRAAIRRGESVFGAIPPSAFALLSRLLAAGAVQRPAGLDQALLYTLRTMDAAALSQTADVGEGLENRILRAAQQAGSREALLALVKCKRYTHARLSRVLTQSLLGVTKALADAYPLPTYARLLAFRRDAGALLRAISEKTSVPIVTRPARFAQGGEALALDIRAGDIWALGLQNAALRAGRIDLTEKVVIVD